MKYTREFYNQYLPGVERSAKVVVPMMIDLIRPRSVIDVGCGVGGWLREFLRQGVADVTGIDGDWVEPSSLQIPEQNFRVADLTHLRSPERKYDLALCLEVAEHLDEPTGRKLVDFLAASSDFIAFSAAVPGQGGTGHINEQWPDYWARVFSKHDYHLFDSVRALLWDDDCVEPWYAQNLVFFSRQGSDHSVISRLQELHSRNAITVRAIHPSLRVGKYS
ncbi:class I SAM-dependent methyltransferase [Streptomyces pseudovenezuelae]|uniref:class I SAM-dependent methyltransferase n=1 Tax=Streptomyces pseudovenezuelae TaxID=67350 RepID=UPI00371E5536